MGGPGSGRKKGGGGKRGVRKVKIAKRKSVWDSMSPKQRSRASSRDRADAKSAAKKNWR